MYRVLICAAACSTLAACGAASRIEAGMNYRSSSIEYRECLKAAPNPQACERQRLVMEADERADANLNGATLNANIRNR